MCAVFLGLAIGHPEWREIADFHGCAPKHQHVDAAVGHAVMTKRFDDPPVGVSGGPRLEPCQLALL